jgi:hypothetical protein
MGLANDHSNVLADSVSLSNCEIEVKNEGTAHGLLLTSLPFTNIS